MTHLGKDLWERMTMGFFKMTKVRALNSETELNEFVDHAEKWIGIRFPLEYLRDNRVMALFDETGAMRGGYALIDRGQLRVVQSLPESATQDLFEQFDRDSLFELTALWLDRKNRSKIASFHFFFRMYFELTKVKRPYFIYAYPVEKSRLGEIYSICKPVKIHTGPTLQLLGMKCAEDEVIEVGSIQALRRAWLKNPGFLFKRLVKKCSGRPLTQEMTA